jgi:hypothetical protein
MEPSIELFEWLHKLGGIGYVLIGGGGFLFTWYLRKNLNEQKAMREELRHFNRILLGMLLSKNEEPKMQELADFILASEQKEMHK